MKLPPCFVNPFKWPPREPQQTPPASIGGGGREDDEEMRPGLKTKMAIVLSMLFQTAIFLLIICPVWELLIRIVVMVALYIVFYVGSYLAFGERFWGLPRSVLLLHQIVLFVIGANCYGHNGLLMLAVLLSNILFMLYVILLPQ